MIEQIYKKLELLELSKSRLIIFALLCGSSLMSLAMFQLRTVLSGSHEFGFLVWNLFLAWLQLGIAYIVSSIAGQRRFLIITLPVPAVLWLLFFPNAPYMLTDLLHLSHSQFDVPAWFDVLFFNWFAWTGVILGVFSLSIIHNLIRKALGNAMGWVFVLVVGILCSIGIYIGRFLEWNSWDVIFHPLEKAHDIVYYVTHPSLQSIIFISIFSMLFIFIYIAIYTFGLLFQEQAQKVK